MGRRTTTGRRRRQKADTDTDFSTSESLALAVEGRIPMSCNFASKSASWVWRKEDVGGRAASRCASCFKDCYGTS